MTTTDKTFLGRGWSFPPAFRREYHGPAMLEGDDDIKSSIFIILSTINGERVMLPTFGCNLQPQVFDKMDVPTITLIQKVVHDALALHEPRIIVENVSATPSIVNQGQLDIDIQYSIITTNTRTNMVYPFYINEATNISE